MVRGKSKRLAAALLLLAGIFIFTGCGEAGRSTRIAFVGDIDSGEYQATNAEIWQGISRYATEHGEGATSYKPGTSGVLGARASMKEAIENGSDIVVCVGDQMANAVYDLQQREFNTQFVLLDAIPSDGTGENKQRIRGNTYSILFDREEAGFLAGYVAVMEGYDHIGFLGGSAGSDDARYGSGFVQGAEAAANEMGLSDGAITLDYGFLTSNAISPEQVTALDAWFSDGVELLCVCGSGPEYIGVESARRTGGRIITADMNSTGSQTIIAASGINYINAVQYALEGIDDESLKGGRTTEIGIEEDGVYMRMTEGGFKSFTTAQYEQLLQGIKDGSISITGDDVLEDPEAFEITKCRVRAR